ncbi:RWP-RK domain, partial [Musa troglodytarum]
MVVVLRRLVQDLMEVAGQLCMSTTDVAFYIIDPHLWGFREACVEHHLQKGQGVAGKTFAQRRPCFSRDITKYCKTGCLAICLSNHLGDDDYILEFFLPADCKSPGEQQDLLNSISGLFKQCFQNLKFITEVKFQGGKPPEVDLITDGSYELRPRLIYSPRGDTHVHIPSEANIDDPVDNDDSLNDENATPDLHKQQLTTDSNAKKNGNKLLDSTALDNKTSYIPAKRRGKPEKTISLELLQQYFSGNLKDAAKSLGVCPTTMKRICRHHGISRWPSRKINKDLQDGAKRSEFSPEKPCDREVQQDQSVSLRVHVKEQVNPQLNPVKDSRRSTGSSSEGSMDAPTSQGSCQGSPVNNFFVSSQPALSYLNQAQGTNCSSKLTLQNACDWSLLNENSLPIAVNSKPQLPVGVVIKDSGSSKDLKIHCTFARVGSRDEHAMILTRDTSQPWVSQETKAHTIKASYKEDIIRFRLPHNAGILALKDEISKKLKLEVGTFDIKYLDDDHEWVMLTCDWDLEECLDVSRSSGAHIIRLSVHDTVTNLGSSCESSEVDYHNYVTRQFNVRLIADSLKWHQHPCSQVKRKERNMSQQSVYDGPDQDIKWHHWLCLLSGE